MAKIFFLTGTIQSGKTTRLANWCSKRHDTGGLLSPVLFGKRCFLNLRTQERYNMEAAPEETDVQQVGRYTFSTSTFNRANSILLQNNRDPEVKWLIIDEIGPLELQGKGLHPALEIIFNSLASHQQLVLVIRENILENVLETYDLKRHGVAQFHFPEN